MNYLTKVIVRADFISEISSLNQEMPPEVNSVAVHDFPIVEPQSQTVQDLAMVAEGIQGTISKKIVVWNYYSKDRNKRLCISSQFLFIECDSYSSFEDIKEPFIKVVNALNGTYNNLQISRIGLRYIDEIEPGDKNPLDWSKYIRSELLAILKVPKDPQTISRAFHTLVTNNDGYSVKFQYGIFNPDFPAPVRKKQFVLDTDVYRRGIMAVNQIEELLLKFRDEAKSIFEGSIKEGLRRKMNE